MIVWDFYYYHYYNLVYSLQSTNSFLLKFQFIAVAIVLFLSLVSGQINLI